MNYLCLLANQEKISPYLNGIARWLSAFITFCHSKAKRPLQGRVRAHSIKNMASTAALYAGVPLRDICCRPAAWSSCHMFMKHYCIDEDAEADAAVGQAGLDTCFVERWACFPLSIMCTAYYSDSRMWIYKRYNVGEVISYLPVTLVFQHWHLLYIHMRSSLLPGHRLILYKLFTLLSFEIWSMCGRNPSYDDLRGQRDCLNFHLIGWTLSFF